MRAKCFAGMVPIYSGDKSVDQLYRKAQVAMMTARRENRLWTLYQPSQDQFIKDQVALLSDLRWAVIKKDMDIFIQPQFDLKTGELVGGEILSRWRHTSRGDVDPQLFIGLAEKSGLIFEITSILIEQSFKWINDQKLENFKLAINLSILDLLNDQLLIEVDKWLSNYSINAQQIVFEITESIDMHNAEEVLNVLREFKYRGFQIAIDDFGTGYSSMAYLSNIRPDWIKIDRSFVKQIDQSPTHQVIIKAILEMATSLGAETVAEGIESESESKILREIGVKVAQGFFWAKPQPLKQFDPQQYFQNTKMPGWVLQLQDF